jgi:hypothetical protein
MVAQLESMVPEVPARRWDACAESAVRALTTVQLGVELLSAFQAAELSDLDRSLVVRSVARATQQVSAAVAVLLESLQCGLPGT